MDGVTPGPAPVEHLQLAFGRYALPGRCRRVPGQHIGLLAIHGTRADHRRLDSLLGPLHAAGVGSLAFDLSGHSQQSPLANADTSLAHNLHEALRFAALLGTRLHTVLGHSLGGALAMKLAEHGAQTIKTLVLSGPALYPQAAYAVARYGPLFTQAISRPLGFMDSSSLPFLRRFQGQVLLITGEYDGLPAEQHGGVRGRSAGWVEVRTPSGALRTVYSPIPAEVFAAIRDAAAGRLSEVVLAACDHQVFSHLAAHPPVAGSLTQWLLLRLSAGAPARRCCIHTDGTVHPQ